MVEDVGKTGAISNQKFSQKGMQLSQLKENKQVYEFFKNAGLTDNNYVYASDIQNIFDKYDENDNGKLSVKEARAMGLEGSRKDIKKAVKLMNEILETQLNDADGVFPAKVDDNTTQYFDKDGKIKYQAQTIQSEDGNVEKYTFYRDGDTAKIASYAEKSDNFGVVIQFNEANLPEKETVNNDGNLQTTAYEYDETNNQLKRQTIEYQGGKTVIDFDEQKRPVKTVETEVKTGFSSITENQYDDENGTMTQIIKSNPELLKDGIAEAESKYTIDQESGKTDILLYRKEVGIDGKVKEFAQISPDEIEEKRDGLTIRTKWHENGKTSTVQDGDETHVIEYDKDGNTYVYVKNGETLKETAQRLLGKDATEEDINTFRELNKDLIKTYGKNKIEAFNVGEKIRVQGELEYNEANKANLTVDPKKELKAFKNTPGEIKDQDGAQSAKPDNKSKPEKNADTDTAKVVTLDLSKKQLDEKGVKYTVKGNVLSFVDKKGRKVVMTYQNGYKAKETAYPPNSQNTEGKQLTGRRYYDKEYKNGVLVKEKQYFDANPNKVAVQKDYENGQIAKEIKCMNDEEKIKAIAHLRENGLDVDSVKFMHAPKVKERTDFIKGEKVRTTYYNDGDPAKINRLETFKDGYTTTTVYEDGDTSKVMSIGIIYPEASNVVRKDYRDGNLEVVTNLFEGNSNIDLKPEYNDKGEVEQYVKSDGTTWDYRGNLEDCPFADKLYKHLKGYSDNEVTRQMLDEIKESNVVDVLEHFAHLSPNEQFFEYVNNEWGSGLGRAVTDQVLKKLLDLGKKYNVTNDKLDELLNNNQDNKRSKYNMSEIRTLNENVPLVVSSIRNKYKTLINENM